MRRAARILPGYWLALLVTFVLSLTVFGAALDGQLVLRLVAGIVTVADWHWITLFPVEVNGPLWSISFEVTSYLLLPLGFAALFLIGRWSGQGWQSRLLWLGVPYGFPWFVLAVGLFLSSSPSSALLGRLLDNPVTRYIAKISFGIYIWHYPVLELVRVYWDPQIDHGQSSDPTRFVVTCTIITVITFTVAHLSYHLVENPVIQWARARERRGAGSATLSPAAG